MDEQQRQAVHLEGDIINKSDNNKTTASPTTAPSGQQRRQQLEQQLLALRATSLNALPSVGKPTADETRPLRPLLKRADDDDGDTVTVCSCTYLDKVVCGGSGAANHNNNNSSNILVHNTGKRKR